MNEADAKNLSALAELLSRFSGIPAIGDLQTKYQDILSSGTSDNIPLLHQVFEKSVPHLEQQIWNSGIEQGDLDLYQLMFRQVEELVSPGQEDKRYQFVVVIPVADRPQHLTACMASLLQLCQLYAYGGQSDNKYKKISVVIADDSKQSQSIEENQKIAEQFDGQGLRTVYFGQQEQKQLVGQLSAEEKQKLTSVIGDVDHGSFSHKGASIMRNMTYLKLNQIAENSDRLLFFFIDSDQEFKVKIQHGNTDSDVYALNYFYHLDKIFSTDKVDMLTGKVVGDPPVSPSVMAGNFLEDVSGFLMKMSKLDAQSSCSFHCAGQRTSDASYHDMADLFGFSPEADSYDYACLLQGDHDHIACFNGFSEKVNHFFDGEHPTRKTYFEYEDMAGSVKPARTVYTGNYVFNPIMLKYFIPFAPLKLRMAGPVLGRLVKSEAGERFVSANLPMLHKRTVDETGQSEFRPGIDRNHHEVDLSGEFERQFFGDVMLFTMERLTQKGYPGKHLAEEFVESALVEVESEMLARYSEKHQQIMARISGLTKLFSDKDNWWADHADLDTARNNIQNFIDNVEYNFGEKARGYQLIESTKHRSRRRSEILGAILSYADQRKDWERILGNNHHGVSN